MNNGDIIGGRYRLDRKIGQGGTGRIWLAHDGRLDRRVAIKFLFANTPAQQARLARRVALEAKIAASIQHRNVIQIFDFGTHDEGIPYIVMEALTGFTLGEAFDATQSFSLDTLIHIVSEVLRGLSAVHDAGIVHRDIKPENIFLVKETRGKLSPKLLDFGISRSLEPDMRPSAVTTTEGMILGTPQYMSPEQARGEKAIDKRTDIYSIGTIMFEAFAGIVPFPAGNTAELLIAVIQHQAPPLYEHAPQIGRALCAVVDKALAKNRAQRYAHAAEMLDAVLAAAQEVPPELDRQADRFPPEIIRTRSQHSRGDSQELMSLDAAATSTVSAPPNSSATVHAGRRGSTPLSGQRSLISQPLSITMPVGTAAAARLPFVLPRAAWLAVAALAVFGISLAAFALFERMREPEGSGLIVVQAPNANLATTQPAAAKLPTPPAPNAEPAPAPEERADGASRKPTGAKQRKATPADPMQLMAARVAEAFSKQKASVIACLSEHAADLEGAGQLQVRLMIDTKGVANDAELLPAEISGKPVARCLKSAVTKMTFPRPEQPTTFRVPLLWRRK